jgi:DASH complex subunit DAD2
VIGNWHNVLRAINMASGASTQPAYSYIVPEYLIILAHLANLPKPNADDPSQPTPLPQTLVRIPTEHAPAIQAHTEGNGEDGEL